MSWNVDSKSLNFGSQEQHNQPSPFKKRWNGAGYSVTFDPGPPSVSRLMVNSATPSDSGRYTCQPSSGLSASTHVHVALGKFIQSFYFYKSLIILKFPGNEMAAIQAADTAGRDGCLRWFLLTIAIVLPLLNLNWYD